MTRPNSLRDLLLPLVEAGKQESADTGLDTHLHAIAIARRLGDVTAAYGVGYRQLVDYIRHTDADRTMSAGNLAAAIAARISADTGAVDGLPDQTLPAITTDIEQARQAIQVRAGSSASTPPPAEADRQVTIVVDEAHEIVTGQYGEGKTLAAQVVLWQLIHAGYTLSILDVKRSDHSAWLSQRIADADAVPAHRIATQQADPAEVALAMTGARAGELTMGEADAVARGVSVATYRRLYPAVTGDLADRLVMRFVYLASHLAAHLAITADDDDVSGRLTRDPRSAGFRLALFEARRLATTEPMRRLAMLVEWAMTAVALGREQSALDKLARADAILS